MTAEVNRIYAPAILVGVLLIHHLRSIRMKNYDYWSEDETYVIQDKNSSTSPK